MDVIIELCKLLKKCENEILNRIINSLFYALRGREGQSLTKSIFTITML